MELKDYLEAVIDAQTMEQVWQIHVDAMAAYGFDRLIYGFTRFRTANSFGAPEDLLILTNHAESYTDRFIGEGMYFHAPMVKWASENVGACSWGWIAQSIDTMPPSELKVVEFNRSQGVTAGYSVSFNNSSRRSKGAIALTGKRGTGQAELDAMWAEHGREIILARQPQVLFDGRGRQPHDRRDVLRGLAVADPFERLALALGQAALGMGEGQVDDLQMRDIVHQRIKPMGPILFSILVSILQVRAVPAPRTVPGM